jgi:hypothetical protein
MLRLIFVFVGFKKMTPIDMRRFTKYRYNDELSSRFNLEGRTDAFAHHSNAEVQQ